MIQWFASYTHTLASADPSTVWMHLFASLARPHKYHHDTACMWTVDIVSLKFIYSDLSEIAIKWTKTNKQYTYAANSIQYIVTVNVNMKSSKHLFFCCACCLVVQVFRENLVPFHVCLFAGGTTYICMPYPPHCLQLLTGPNSWVSVYGMWMPA